MKNWHTPGPWEAVRLQPDGRIIQREAFEIRTPAYDVCTWNPKAGPIRKEADAHLIAAAPNLLAALEPFAWLARVMVEGETLHHKGVYITYKQARAAKDALDKARGETQ